MSSTVRDAHHAYSSRCRPRTGTHVKFEILRATHLANKDGSFGLSDPYVRAYAHGQKIGSTSVVSNSLNPVWPGDGTVYS